MAIITPRNDALDTHPPAGDQYLTTNGSNWLFAVTAIFGVLLLALYALNFRPRAGERFFHYVFIAASFAGLFAYYAMASDLAWDLVPQANQIARSGVLRQIFWAKYPFWIVSFGAAVLALGVLSGASWATILFHLFLAWTWVLSYLFAAYTPSNYKWGFFAFGVLAHLFLAFGTLFGGRTAATRVGVSRDYLTLAGWANLLWLLYPIAWGLSDGGNYLGVTPSFIFFGILDVLFVVGLAIGVVILSRRWDYGRLNIAFTQYGRVPHSAGTFPEKHTATPATTAAV
jgi:bacteriorhodopsin